MSEDIVEFLEFKGEPVIDEETQEYLRKLYDRYVLSLGLPT